MADRTELSLRLWESLIQELVRGRVLDAEAVERVLAGVARPGDEGGLGVELDAIRRRVRQAPGVAPGVPWADRDREPNTPD